MMKLKTFFVVNAIVSCLFGIVALLAPAQALSLFGVETDPVISMLARFTGLGSVALGLVPWFARDMELYQAKNTIIPALLICAVIGIVVSVLGLLSDGMKMGWPPAFMYLVYAVGYAWILFSRSQKIQAKQPHGLNINNAL